MTKQELANWCDRHGYSQRRNSGNFYKEKNGKLYRIKVQANSIRYEYEHSYTTNDYFGKERIEKIWIRKHVSYLKDVSVNPENDKLRFGKEIH